MSDSKERRHCDIAVPSGMVHRHFCCQFTGLFLLKGNVDVLFLSVNIGYRDRFFVRLNTFEKENLHIILPWSTGLWEGGGQVHAYV